MYTHSSKERRNEFVGEHDGHLGGFSGRIGKGEMLLIFNLKNKQQKEKPVTMIWLSTLINGDYLIYLHILNIYFIYMHARGDKENYSPFLLYQKTEWR